MVIGSKDVPPTLWLTLNRPGFLQIGMAGESQLVPFPPPLPACNFCLNGLIDLKFGMQMVKVLDIEKKILKKLPGSCSKR